MIFNFPTLDHVFCRIPIIVTVSRYSCQQLKKEKEREDKQRAKEQALAKKKMEAELFKTAQPVQKIPFGTGRSCPSSFLFRADVSDPKSVLCIYFKNGHCEKGQSSPACMS